MMRLFNFIKNYYLNLIIILSNIFYLKKLIISVLCKTNIFLVGNGKIGHYPPNIFFAHQIYGSNTIFALKSGVNFDNQFLYKKCIENYNFDQSYEKIYHMNLALNFLAFNAYKINLFPEFLHMTKDINFAETFDGKSTLFDFNQEENNNGQKYFDKHEIQKDKYVCFLLRTNEYYNSVGLSHRNEKMEFRNVNPTNYLPTIDYLIEKGFKVIRMGKGFTDPFPYYDNNFIDYAISEFRSDFLDVWLSANCKFFLSCTTGIGSLPMVFNKPFFLSNWFPVGRMISYAPKSMHLPRIAVLNDKFLSLKEMIQTGAIYKIDFNLYSKLGVKILENTSEDILNSTKDMLKKIENGFNVTPLNKKFWNNLKNQWDRYTGEIPASIKSSSSKAYFNFDHFHKIDGIKTTIPDSYLNKYSDVFFNN